MEGNEAAMLTVRSSIDALGRGFDVNCDTRLLYCKGGQGSRVVDVDEEHVRDLPVFDGMVVPNVPREIRCSQEPGGRENAVVCSFDQMAECFNKNALLSGNSPLGSFNSAFSFTGSREVDASTTKNLAMDGVSIPLCKVQLDRSPLSLKEDVKRAVPLSWEPSLLASFIENYGTHVITSVTIGGKDVIYAKQQSSSLSSLAEIKNHIQEIGNQRFSDVDILTSSGPTRTTEKVQDSVSFNSQGIYPQPMAAPFLGGKEDVTVIFRRRGGNDLVQSHIHWKRTVREAPDVIDMAFCPITSLIEGVPGNEHLFRAINLYLEYKPPIEELRYFLEFQLPRIWAPVRDEIPGRQRREPVCASLQFSLMGPKLYISQEQVSVGRKPVTGLRLTLEGSKQNRLAVHVQHLSSLPKLLRPYWDSHIPIGAPKWLGPEEQDSRWFEPVKWKNFSHVSTAPIECNETFISDLSGAHVVTGAQLGVWDFGSKSVLYMKLLYSKIPGCTIRRSLWDHNPVESTDDDPRRAPTADSSGSGSSNLSSSETATKLRKLVDMSEMVKGPKDSPGHWLVSGGKLGVKKGKIMLRVKYSLLNY